MNKEKVKEATEHYINVVLQQAEDKAGVSMTETLIESTSSINKLSSSLLIVSGAAITLSIGNADSVISALGKGSFKILIILLIISAIFGFLSTAAHSFSMMLLDLAKSTTTKFGEIFDDFDKFEEEQIKGVKDIVEIELRHPSTERVLESFISTLPVFMQRTAKDFISTPSNNDKILQRSASTLAYSHVVIFFIQTIFMVIAFVSAVFGIE